MALGRTWKRRKQVSVELNDRWIGKDDSIEIRNFTINGGFFSVGSYDHRSVNPKLDISKRSFWSTEELRLFTPYSVMSPQLRGAYLKWLSKGRIDPKVPSPCLFNHLFGLEKRLLDPGPVPLTAEERKDVVAELLRLSEVYSHLPEFLSAVRSFLAIQWALYCGASEELPEYVDVFDPGCSIAFRLVLVRAISQGQPVAPEYIAHSILLEEPRYRKLEPEPCAMVRELVALKITPEIASRFYGKVEKTLHLSYASRDPFSYVYGFEVDRFGNIEPIHSMYGILRASSAQKIKAVEAYFNSVAKHSAQSVISLAQYPPECLVRSSWVAEAKDRLGLLCAEEPALVRVDDVLSLLRLNAVGSPSKHELAALRAVVKRLDFALLPDPKFFPVNLDTKDLVVIFAQPVPKNHRPSREMLKVTLALNAIYCLTRGRNLERQEQDLVARVLEDFPLALHETQMLKAFMLLNRVSLTDKSLLGRELGRLSFVQAAYIRSVLLDFSSLKPKPDPIEEDTRRYLYEAMGFSATCADTDLVLRPRPQPKLHWLGKGEVLAVQGFRLEHGFIYIQEKDSQFILTEPSAIDPELKAIRTSGCEDLKPNQNYATWTPAQRGRYLEWLENGCTTSIEPGFIRNYLYGMERRFFHDDQLQALNPGERAELLAEVERVHTSLPEGDFNSDAYIMSASILAFDWVEAVDRENHTTPGYFGNMAVPQPFKLTFAEKMGRGEQPHFSWVLHWAGLSGLLNLNKHKQFDLEFINVFEHEYNLLSQTQCLITESDSPLILAFQPMNPSVDVVESHHPHLRTYFPCDQPMEALKALINLCWHQLAHYISARLAGYDLETFDDLLFLEEDVLRVLPVASNAIMLFSEWTAEGPAPVVLGEILSALNKDFYALSSYDLSSLQAVLARLGFGIAPDVDMHGVKSTAKQEVVLFQCELLKEMRPKVGYKTTAVLFRLGAQLLHKGSGVSVEHGKMMFEMIEKARDLTDQEKRSLEALWIWCSLKSQSVAGLKKQLSKLHPTRKQAIAASLCRLAKLSGSLKPAMIKQLEKHYQSLSLDPARVARDLHEVSAADGPVMLAKAGKAMKFSLPKPGETKPKAFVLDHQLIAQRQAETHKVQSVLGSIFSEVGEPALVETPAPSADGAGFGGLDAAHQQLLLALCTQETWERGEVLKLCKSMGLLLDGAMETLNEWAFSKVDAGLIEDGPDLLIDLEIAKEILGDRLCP